VHRSLIFYEHCWSQPDEAASESYSTNDSSTTSTSNSSSDSGGSSGNSGSMIDRRAVVLAHGGGERVPALVAVGAVNEGIAPQLRPEMRG
jgi:hypothetical protein